MPGGRPTDYEPEFCARVIEVGATGASRVEIAVELDVVKSTLQNWEATHPEFLVAMTRAMALSQVWWERKGRDNLSTQIFQASMWSRSMAARFPDDWREKAETTVNAGEGFSEILAIAGAGGVFPKKSDDAAQ